MNISCLDKYQGNYGVRLYVSTCIGIVGGDVGKYWIKRGTCGTIEANIVIVVFTTDLIILRSNT